MTLSKRSNGIYYFWFTPKGGKRKKVSTGETTRARALEFVRCYQEAGMPVKSISWEAFSELFQAHLRGDHAKATQALYKTACSELGRALPEGITVGNVSSSHIEAFFALKRSSGTSQATRATYYAHLRTIFNYARRRGFIAESPFVHIARIAPLKRVPPFMTECQFDQLLIAIGEHPIRKVVLVGVYTGMRLGELLALLWEDVHLEGCSIMVRSTPTHRTKTGRDRNVPVCSQLRFVLEGMARDAPLVFHEEKSALDPEEVSKTFKTFLRVAHLPEEIHFHSLRHTFASWLVQRRVSLYAVSQLLGHSSIKVTECYAALAPSTLLSSVDVLPALEKKIPCTP